MWAGAVLAPFLGIAGDRIGLRALLCLTRGGYALLAAILTALAKYRCLLFPKARRMRAAGIKPE